MTIVRAIDTDNDWLFGKGRNDYVTGNDAIAQNIQTRLQSFLGDCFFDAGAGVDWFNLLGSKNEQGLILAVKTIILNTELVTGLIELQVLLDSNRHLSLIYSVNTVLPGNLKGRIGLLLTEEGDVITTEGGDPLGA